MSKEITEQEFYRTMLLGMQVSSTHLCALALGAKVPNPNYGKPMSNLTPADSNVTGKQKDKRVFIPMTHDNAMYHAGAQHQLNTMIDELVGTSEEEAAMMPQVVPPGEAPDNVVDISAGLTDPDDEGELR